MLDAAFRAKGDAIVLLGEDRGELGGSEYLKVVHGIVGGKPPALDLAAERACSAARGAGRARLHSLRARPRTAASPSRSPSAASPAAASARRCGRRPPRPVRRSTRSRGDAASASRRRARRVGRTGRPTRDRAPRRRPSVPGAVVRRRTGVWLRSDRQGQTAARSSSASGLGAGDSPAPRWGTCLGAGAIERAVLGRVGKQSTDVNATSSTTSVVSAASSAIPKLPSSPISACTPCSIAARRAPASSRPTASTPHPRAWGGRGNLPRLRCSRAFPGRPPSATRATPPPAIPCCSTRSRSSSIATRADRRRAQRQSHQRRQVRARSSIRAPSSRPPATPKSSCTSSPAQRRAPRGRARRRSTQVEGAYSLVVLTRDVSTPSATRAASARSPSAASATPGSSLRKPAPSI